MRRSAPAERRGDFRDSLHEDAAQPLQFRASGAQHRATPVEHLIASSNHWAQFRSLTRSLFSPTDSPFRRRREHFRAAHSNRANVRLAVDAAGCARRVRDRRDRDKSTPQRQAVRRANSPAKDIRSTRERLERTDILRFNNQSGLGQHSAETGDSGSAHQNIGATDCAALTKIWASTTCFSTNEGRNYDALPPGLKLSSVSGLRVQSVKVLRDTRFVRIARLAYEAPPEIAAADDARLIRRAAASRSVSPKRTARLVPVRRGSTEASSLPGRIKKKILH